MNKNLFWLMVPVLLAGVSPAGAVTIHNPWIVNDRVADAHNINTMAATYVNSYTPDGVVTPPDDQAKAINIYDNQKRRLYHWADEPPGTGGNINDPTYNQNVFGWSLCGRHASQACTIVKAAGLTQRKISFPGHWTYEVQYDGTYHQFDTMCTHYVYNRATPRKVCSCAEISADHTLELNAVAEGRACPGYLLCGDTPDGYVYFCDHWGDAGDGSVTPQWTGNMDLREGEVFYRGWDAWQNEHPTAYTDADSMPGVDPPYHHESQHDWKDYVNYYYWEPYGVIIPYIHATKTTYRRWSNGTDTITPDFHTAAYQDLLYSSTNIATYYTDGLTPDLHANSTGTLAEAVFRVQVPFFLTDGSVSGTFKRTNAGDITRILTSPNGTSWTQVWDNTSIGDTVLSNLSLRNQVFGNYNQFFIKVQIQAVSNKTDAGVTGLTFSIIFEHNKGAMAYLDKGTNNVTVTMDNPQDLGGSNVLKVTYKWKEYSGSDWTVDQSLVKYITASPSTFTVITGGTKVPRTEYIQMEVIPTPPPDGTPPAAITDLATTNPSYNKMTLTWTATGDDGNVGQAMAYDLRYSASAINEGNFSSATQVTGVPGPKTAGQAETFTVTGLSASTTYYFAIKACDEGGMWSGISNVPSATTLPPDTQGPNAVSNLAASVSSPIGAILCTWTAPSDVGGGYVYAYDLRYSTSTITEGNWGSATQVTGEPTPKSPGSSESCNVTGLTLGTTYYFALKSRDDSGNWSALSNVPSCKSSVGTQTLQYGLNGYSNTQDSYIGYNNETNYDYTSRMSITGYDVGNYQRGLVQFDVSSIPTGATITNALLYLYAYDPAALRGSTGYYGAYPLTKAWTASQTTWTKASSTLNWTTPGGDFDATPDGTAPKQAVANVWYIFDVTSKVQYWINNGQSTNYGWIIRCTDEVLHNQDNMYQCSTSDAAHRPKLVISDQNLDVWPPAAVTNLSCSNITATSVQLNWTAPGDDGNTGTATTYDIRYSTSAITGANWGSATQVTGEPAPQVAGTNQSMTVSGLTADTTYYFAMMTADEQPNWSNLSNVPSAKTTDSVAPDAVTNLAVGVVTDVSVALSWTAPGDNGTSGTATSYDLRYSTSPINDGNFSSATQVSGVPAPQAPGSTENFTVPSLNPDTTYYFAIKTADEVPNWSALSNVPSAHTLLVPDTTAPAAVTDLATSNPTSTSITLSWTAPGDDGNTGTATSYDVRYSISTIDDGNWDSATQAAGEPTPQIAGTPQNMVVGGLQPSTTYYFAMKTCDEVLNVSGLSNVPSGSTVATSTRQVGPGKTYSTIQAAVDASADYDTIEVYPATYTQSEGWASIPKNHLTIRGVGTMPVLDAAGSCKSGKGIFIVSGTDLTVENLEFKNTTNPTDKNAAAFRLEAASLTIRDCYIHDNDEGILSNSGISGSTVLVERCEFYNNGYGNGSSHGIYLNYVDTFTLRYCWIHHQKVGHEVKTRAGVNYILYNRIGNEGGNASYEIDVPNGGTTYIIGNQMEQSSTTSNPGIIMYAEEGATNPDQHLYVVNNTIVNNRSAGCTFVNNASTTSALLQNNIFQGVGTVLSGLGSETTDWATSNAYLVDPVNYNFRLTINSTGAINMGTTPGQGINGFDMNPTLQYVHPCSSENRPVASNIDIGAYEYPGTGDTTPPAAVSDLAISNPTSNSVTLTWTAPGDDDNTGTAASYDVRYSTSTITEGNWAIATQVTGEPTPQVAGTPQNIVVSGLSGGVTYYFAMKTSDEVPNISALSNVPSVTTPLGQRVFQNGVDSYTGCADSYIYVGAPTTNYGTNQRMTVCGYADQNSVDRGSVKFDLSSLSPSLTITRATLYLYSYDPAQVRGSTGYYGVHALTHSWTEAGVTWNTYDGTNAWTNPGGDFNATEDATAPKQAVAEVWYSWEVTSRVQDWIANPSNNNGWIVKCTDENLHNQDYFYQSDATNATYRPKLVVTDLPGYAVTTVSSPLSGGTITGGGTYTSGETCNLTAYPDTSYGFTFDHWSGSPVDGQTANPVQFTVTADATITAVFQGPAGYIDVANYTELKAAIQSQAVAGNIIRVHPGTYTMNEQHLDLNNGGTVGNPITVTGILDGSQRPILQAAPGQEVDRGFFFSEPTESNWVFENLEFQNLRGLNVLYSPNAAAAYIQGDNITFRNCLVHDCDQGFSSSADNTNGLIEYCEVYNCGSDLNYGYSHLIYMLSDTLTVRGCYLHDAYGGLLFKTRANSHVLEYNWLETDGSEAFVAGLASGNTGNSLWRGNVFIKRSAAGGQRRIISIYDTVGSLSGTLTMINNTIVSALAADIYIGHVAGSSCNVVLKNNVFAGPSDTLFDWNVSYSQLSGTNNLFKTAMNPVPSQLVNNIYTDNAGFVDLSGRDLHLTQSSACVNAGQNGPTYLNSLGQWVDGTPTYEPTKTLSLDSRATNGTLDIGAYEYGGVTLPSVQFSTTSSSGSESVTSVSLVVTLSASSSQTVTVDYAVTGGTAVSPDDYTISGTQLTFNPGETSKNVPITVVDDAITESDETIVVTLSNPTNATLGANTTHTYTINDNDVAVPTVQFSTTSSSGSESVTSVSLVVTLSASSGQTVTVDYAVTGGTATSPDDYTISGTQLTFNPGVTSQNVPITVVDDSLVEGDETIIVTLSNPTNATLGANTTHTYTINDNDAAPPTVEFSLSSSSGSEATTSVNLAVTLSASSSQTITVDYAATGGTAVSPDDYTISGTQLTFNPGVTTQNVPITVVNDSAGEFNETIIVTLSDPVNATLGANTTHTYTINDNDVMDCLATSDIPVYGTVGGSYTNTFTSNNVYESIREVLGPGNRYSWCEHKWTFDVRPGSSIQFRLEAYRPSNSDGDDFQFAYSLDDSSYTNMVTVTKSSDDNTDQTYSLPAGTSGTVYVRVQDTNRKNKNTSLDYVYIDHMVIRSNP